VPRLTKEERLSFLEVRDLYVQATGETEYIAEELVSWAEERSLVRLSKGEMHEILVERMSEALRGEEVDDGCGNRARANYCVKVVKRDPDSGNRLQRLLWSNYSDASEDFLIRSIEERCKLVEQDVEKIKIDVAFLNRIFVERGRRPIQGHFSWVWHTRREGDHARD
jgi:hypothetical protein